MSKNVLQVSFKNNIKELELYYVAINSYNVSAFVKECIAFYLENKGNPVKNEEKASDNNIQDIDWEF